MSEEEIEKAEVKTVARALAYVYNTFYSSCDFEINEEHFIGATLPYGKYVQVHYSPNSAFFPEMSEHDIEMLMYEAFGKTAEDRKERTGIGLFFSPTTKNFYHFVLVFDRLYKTYEVVVFRINQQGMKDWSEVDLGYAVYNGNAVKL